MDAGTASTDIMEAPEWVECYSLEEEEGAEELWKLVSKEEQHGELLRALNRTKPKGNREVVEHGPLSNEHEKEEQFDDVCLPSDTPTTTEPRFTPPSSEPSVTPHSNKPSITRPTRKSSSTIPPTHTCTRGVEVLPDIFSSEHVQSYLKDKEGKVLGQRRLVHFIDTGGQAIYHDVHPILITSPSVYLVVFSLKELYQKKSHEEQLAYFRSDLIQRPLRSIYTFGTKTPQKKDNVVLSSETPKILIVGTHLDQIPLEDSGMEVFLDDISKRIEKEIGNKPYRPFVQYDPKDRSFWAVDNTQAGKEQHEAVKEYNAAFRMMVQAGSTEMSVRVPLPWMLLKLVMEGKRQHHCKHSELLEEARIRGYVKEDSPEADLDAMLWLFHTLGLLYHKVPSGCSKEESLVFIDPDCLYSATSDFLMAAKEEIEDRSEDQHQTQSTTKEETEDSQGGSEDHHQTPVASKEEMLHGQEMAGKGSRPQEQEPRGIVQKKRVIRRIQCNSDSIKHELEAVLQTARNAMKQEATEDVLKSLPDQLNRQLKKIEQEYNLPSRDCQDALSVKAKQQLYVRRLVHSLASSVKAVLDDAGRKGDVQIREEVDKAIENIRKRYQSRSIDISDMDQFLAILSDLRIVAKLRDSDSYVVPAALPHEVPHSEIVGNAAPILITVVSQTIMEVCYLPSGLFCCLISELVTEAGWTVDPLGRTHVAFTHKDFTGKVHVLEHESYIEIKMESQASLEELSRTCQSVRETIHKHVVPVYKTLYSGPIADSTFEESLVWGFHCEEHPCDKTHIAAFRKIDDDEYWTECLLDTCNVRDVEPEELVWFGSELDMD